MARDSKVVQRGVNVQSNDFAVEPGSAQHAVNVDNYRDGVASRRIGFESYWDGLPQIGLDSSRAYRNFTSILQTVGTKGPALGTQRGFWELFSKDHAFCLSNGILFSYVDALADQVSPNQWQAVPSLLSHQFRFHGDTKGNSTYIWQLGKMIGGGFTDQFANPISPFSIADTIIREGTAGGSGGLIGAIGNSQAQASTSSPVKFFEPFDVLFVGNTRYASDNTTIRNASTGAVLAGSITASGSTDGVGSAARFNNASWMATDKTTTIWVADNTNEIRKVVVSSGSVTTLAGSVTAGDVDGVGTAARFRTISGLAYDGSQFLYVSESGGHRIRKVDVNSGSVTIFAGPLSPSAGYVDGIGTAAQFNTPTGIEYISGFLYVGDSANNVVREVKTSNQNVISYTKNGNSVTQLDGIIGGMGSISVLPGVVVRSQWRGGVGDISSQWPIGNWLAIECTTATNEMIDLGLVAIAEQGTAATALTTKSRIVAHYARCPNGYPNSSTGPLKLDTFGPNAYSIADTRGVDVGGGCMFTTRSYPRSIDLWTKTTEANPMPRLRPVGISAPEAPSCTTAGGGSTFVNNTSWAYRTLCGLTLKDGRTIMGPPSERVIVTNTSGGTVSCNVQAFASSGLPYDGMAFVQVYRTQTFPSSVDPGDQMFLCFESAITYGSGVLFADSRPDGLLGAELYTNATQPGALAASSLPPPYWANDVASFKKAAVFSNYISPASVRVKCLGTSPLSAGSSTVTFSSYMGNFTATAISSATDPGNRNFQIATGGSAAQNAAQTARNISTVINRSPDAWMFTSAYDESDPGSFIVTSLFPGLSAKTTFTEANAVGATSGTTVQSYVTFSSNAGTAFMTIEAHNSIRQQNAVAYSDQGDFDSFPVGNTTTVGPSTEGIVRILPISDRLLTVKDDSVWAFDETFTSQIYDTALSCNLANSFAKVNNQWVGLFTRGLVALNTTQATAIGRPIDRDVFSQFGNSINYGSYDRFIDDFSSAAAIDLSGNYICTINRRTFVYNAITGILSEWLINTNTIQADNIAGTIAAQHNTSGMRWLGSYKDRFFACIDAPRGVFHQRDWRLTQIEWVRDFSDMAWTFANGVLAADLLTINVAAYDGSNNPGVYPPFSWVPPSGSTSPLSMASATALWIAAVTQGGQTRYVQATVDATTAASSTSPVTIVMKSTPDGFTAGSVSVVAYAPIVTSVQWAPTIIPGVDTKFNDTLFTLERSLPGYLVARWMNRSDLSTAKIQTSGLYDANQGVSRAISMSTISVDVNPANAMLRYNSVERFDTPSERSYDQQVTVELWEATAMQPLAIKSVVIDHRPTDNTKVKQ